MPFPTTKIRPAGFGERGGGNVPMGVGLRPGAKAAGRATDPPTGHAPPLDSTRMVSVP